MVERQVIDNRTVLEANRQILVKDSNDTNYTCPWRSRYGWSTPICHWKGNSASFDIRKWSGDLITLLKTVNNKVPTD